MEYLKSQKRLSIRVASILDKKILISDIYWIGVPLKEIVLWNNIEVSYILQFWIQEGLYRLAVDGDIFYDAPVWVGVEEH